MDLTVTKTKAKATYITQVIAVANTILAYFGISVTAPSIPADATTEVAVAGLVVYVLQVVIYFVPTIVSVIASRYYVAKKTEQNLAVIESNVGKPEVVDPDALKPEVVDPGLPLPQKQYYEPFEPKEMAHIGNAYEDWENFENLFITVDFTKYHPAIRWEFAQQIVDEGFARLIKAWKAEGVNQKAEALPVPNVSDFDSYDTTEEFNKQVRDSIPGCQWVPEGMKSLLIAFGKLYDTQDKLHQIQNKPINWDKAYNLELIRQNGLKAIG